jgi:hypothetical protein
VSVRASEGGPSVRYLQLFRLRNTENGLEQILQSGSTIGLFVENVIRWLNAALGESVILRVVAIVLFFGLRARCTKIAEVIAINTLRRGVGLEAVRARDGVGWRGGHDRAQADC